MPLMASAVSAEVDLAERTALTEGLVTDAGADTDTNASVPLDLIDDSVGPYWESNTGLHNMGRTLWCNIFLKELDGDADSYEVQLLVNNVAAMDSGQQQVVASLHLGVNAPPGLYRFAVDVRSLTLLRPNAAFMALRTVKAGASPSMTYQAWLSAQ